jgi:hypothetical protein
MQNRYTIQQTISGKFDVIDTEYNLIQEPSMEQRDAEIHAAMLNCEHLRDVRRAAKEQRKGRANELSDTKLRDSFSDCELKFFTDLI